MWEKPVLHSHDYEGKQAPARGQQNSSHAWQVKKINDVRGLGDASREENSGIARKTFLSGDFVPQAAGFADARWNAHFVERLNYLLCP